MTDDAVEDVYDLSPMQLGMLFQSLLEPGAGMFVEEQVTPVPDALHPGLLESSWNAVIARTPVLRTSFHWMGIEKPVQVVHRHARLRVEAIDLRALSPESAAAAFAALLAERRRQGFDLEVPPLMRVALVRLAPQDSMFVWHFHHLLIDGWSAPIVLDEVMREYQGLVSGRPHTPRRRPPYRAYIEWLQRQDREAAERFWRDELRGLGAPTRLGIERAAASLGRNGAADREHEVVLGAADSDRLRGVGRENRLTLNALFQGAWALLLSRYSQQADVVFGAVVSGRPPELAGVEEMIGLLINTVPVRVRVEPDEHLGAWLSAIQRRQLAAAAHHHVSALEIHEWSGLPSGTVLFDTVLVFENFPVSGGRDAEPLGDREPACLGRADVGLSVIVIPGRTLRVKFVYDEDRFDEHSIATVAEQLLGLLRAFVREPQARLRDVSVLTAAERRRVVDWNRTEYDGYDAVPLMQRLEDVARQAPEALAFIDAGERVSLRALHERSNQLASFLSAQGVGPGTVVGVSRDRSVDAVCALLAVLKCRGIFLPLDPSYPTDRLAYMAADASAGVVLGLEPSLAPAAKVLAWSEAWAAAAGESRESLRPQAEPQDLAYVIYTSGSTGRPKGVAVEHRAVLNRLAWMWREYPFAEGEIGVVKTALNFVDFFWEALGPLLQAVPSVIAHQESVSDPRAFVDLLATHAVTRLFFVPSFLEMLLESCPDLGRRVPRLRSWWSGGEPLSIDLYRRFEASVPGAVLYNVFGASELWDATVYDPRRDGLPRECVPIGRPIANTQAYVLDAQREPVPVGVTGSLYVGGASLARGYVGQEGLTRERFLPHPFRAEAGARIYDTGDLARCRADGIIEYVGRRDHQLKIRGFRVEPEEVESILDAHPGIRESAVVCRGSDAAGKRLVAYAVARGDGADTEEVLAHLRRSLPAHMVPSIAWIDAIPKTPSGKRDRARLPDEGAAPGPRRPAREPSSPLERLVARRFGEVLGRQVVGVDEDFFRDLGGHSLLAARLVSRLQESTGVELAMRAVFDAPTPAALAAMVEARLAGRGGDARTSAVLSELAALPPDEAEALLAALEQQAEGGEP
jgi:amino acid adenylation domain-containing protein